MLTRLLFIAALSLQLLSAHCQSTDRYTIIPRPAQLEPRVGEFIVSQHTTVMVPFAQADLKAIAESFAQQINHSTGISLMVRNLDKTPQSGQNARANLIQFLPLRDTTMGDEGYHLDVTPQFVTIEAASPKGFFYAVQTLYQLLPPAVLGKERGASSMGSLIVPAPSSLPPVLLIPACRIQDKPRYSYRGMNLDVSRHFFSVAFIKKYLDLMALHKFNNFHWHLTDDQGWRIEIKKYPKLTQIGSRRRETLVGHYDDFDPQVFDGKPYNEFYTQDEIRDVVRYAATKYINVIPEIELPGHALAALASYPELACTTGPYQVATKWGVFDDVFCPTEKTFTFLQDVLTEVMELFPSKYIHIGGDECPKTVWHKSVFCQQLMKREKLKNENQLQSYIITRIDKFVTSKGRRIIGWDEILQGGLSPNATVMSWRGINGGIEAAKQHHDVIMTPGQFCYLNFYQGDIAQEPTAFGGSLPIAKVYSYDPTPANLSPTEAVYILGAQGNVWTEYIATPDQAEYMIWPRAAAMAEVVWTPLALKNYDDFARRLPTHFERLSNLNVNYARTFYDALPAAKPTPDGRVEVTLSPSNLSPEIHYTLDGSIPSGESPRYENPFMLARSTKVRIATFQNGKPLSQLAKIDKEYLVSKATGKSYTLLNAPIGSRPDRNYSLTDGTTGGIGGYEIAGVVAFKNDLNAVIDLGKPELVESVRIGFLKYTAKNICLPKQVEISISEDGKIFKPALTARTNAAESGKRAVVRLPFDFTATTARYIRIIARNVGRVPAGLRYPGKPAQLGVDEIEVR
ncbi:family 20 glycosylhydrolase [Spirosoma sp. HMF4905]|uniref:beta-N-acetylhexosaminidase n=1 Tax=Spirosoma arboris TaxID=2682092 RepID=A0A7K1SPX5_9BACT|nr:glycoside hydrolase family 20 protein [Spirosoma arboris]MVM35827.1 family 20 glycosylhydrolase [Spirosoma arboris]